MSTAEETARKRNRWCCERVDQLLAQEMPRLEILATIRQEEPFTPWKSDPRPAPPPLPMGGYYTHQPA